MRSTKTGRQILEMRQRREQRLSMILLVVVVAITSPFVALATLTTIGIAEDKRLLRQTGNQSRGKAAS